MGIKYLPRISKGHRNYHAYNWLAYNNFDEFLEKLSCRYKGTLFDLGAGTSPYREFFLKYASEYISVDWSGGLHESNVDILADLNKPLPIKTASADTVVSISVMEHLCEPQVMLNEAFRILKPGGSLVLQVPWQWWVHEAPHDYFRYTPYGLKYLLVKAGFTDVVVEPQSGFFTMWLLKFNYFTLRLIRGPKALRLVIKAILLPLWYFNQISAPYLDRLDKNWSVETAGYFVTAFKP